MMKVRWDSDSSILDHFQDSPPTWILCFFYVSIYASPYLFLVFGYNTHCTFCFFPLSLSNSISHQGTTPLTVRGIIEQFLMSTFLNINSTIDIGTFGFNYNIHFANSSYLIKIINLINRIKYPNYLYFEFKIILFLFLYLINYL